MVRSADHRTKSKRSRQREGYGALTDSLLKSVMDVHILFDWEGRYLYVNEPAIRAIGRPREQILGQTLWDICPDLVGTEVERQCHRSMEERLPSVLTFYHAARQTWWEILFEPVPQGFAVLAKDITQRKRAEDAVQEYQKTLEGLEEMIAVIDRDHRYILANRAFLHYRGLQREQLLGTSVADLLSTEIYENIVKKKLDDCFEGKIVKYDLSYVYPHLGRRDVSISYFPIEGSSGIDRVACILQDVTERKRSEEELRELSSRLLRLQDEERRRLARDLHDSTGQNLVALETNLALLRDTLPMNDRKLRKQAMVCQQLADQSFREVRTLSYLLHPPVLEEAGLPDAIRHFVEGFTERSGILVNLEVTNNFGRMTKDLELALFKVVQESLTNVHKHSGSLLAKILLKRSSDQVTVEVSDVGSGRFAENAGASDGIPFRAGVGIAGMMERVKLIGGQLQIISGHSGTTVRATVSGAFERDVQDSRPLTAPMEKSPVRRSRRSTLG